MISFSSPPPSPLLSTSVPRSGAKHIPLRLPEVANLIVKLRRAASHKDVIQSSSGDPRTHPSLCTQNTLQLRKIPLVEERRFLCRGGVDVKKLLRTMRTTLLEEAQTLGANVLVDEQWTSSIHPPKRDGTYKVDIRYAASAARSDILDRQQPVALDRAQGVAGLMTVLE